MAASVDSVVLELEAKLGAYTAEVTSAANASERSFKRIDTAITTTERTMGRSRIGMQQLSYQLGDVSQQFALGTKPMVIFAQQGGQLIQAIQLMTGGTSKFAAFMGGPWGIAIAGAAMVLTPLIAKLFDTRDALDEVGDAALDAMQKLRDGLRNVNQFQSAIDTNTTKMITSMGVLGRANRDIAETQQAIVAMRSTPGGAETVEALTQRLAQLESQRSTAQANINSSRNALDEVRTLMRAEDIRARNEDRMKGGATRSRGTRAGASGLTAEQIEQRHEQALSRLRREEIQAQLALATGAQARADLQQDMLREEYVERSAQLANDEHFTDAQKQAQQAILDSLYGMVRNSEGEIEVSGPGYMQQAITREKARQLEQEAEQIAGERRDAELEALQNQYDLANTEADRRQIALEILAAEDAYLKSKLQAVINSDIASEADRQRAQIALAGLEASAGQRRDLVLRDHQGAYGRYADSLADPKARVEAAVTRKLQAVNDGITDALSEELGVKDQFVKDLFSIFLDEVIFRPLAESLRGRQAGGIITTVTSLLGTIFGGGKPTNLLPGRAGGGPVRAGGAYMVGEVGKELFVPDTSGVVVPNQALRGGMGGGMSVVRLELAGELDARIRRVSGPVAVEVVRASAPQIVDAAAGETMRRASRPRM